MRIDVRLLTTLAVAVALTGCAYRLMRGGPPPFETTHTMRITGPGAQNLGFQVSGTQYPLRGDGLVQFRVPTGRSGCNIDFLGITISRPSDPRTSRIIAISRHGRTVRKLSLAEIRKLPVAPGGEHLLTLK